MLLSETFETTVHIRVIVSLWGGGTKTVIYTVRLHIKNVTN